MKLKIMNSNMEKTGLFDSEGKELSLSEVIGMLQFESVNRIEVIDENGRSYVNWKNNNVIKIQCQDEGRTLKVFVVQKT